MAPGYRTPLSLHADTSRNDAKDEDCKERNQIHRDLWNKIQFARNKAMWSLNHEMAIIF